mmetsp:Transcript_33349/g.80641  ORF Transcript_33349/g.80641 Transcript_33349/m.80641 type:complete len:375 (+) Transcript_33349:112-1236(+)
MCVLRSLLLAGTNASGNSSSFVAEALRVGIVETTCFGNFFCICGHGVFVNHRLSNLTTTVALDIDCQFGRAVSRTFNGHATCGADNGGTFCRFTGHSPTQQGHTSTWQFGRISWFLSACWRKVQDHCTLKVYTSIFIYLTDNFGAIWFTLEEHGCSCQRVGSYQQASSASKLAVVNEGSGIFLVVRSKEVEIRVNLGNISQAVLFSLGTQSNVSGLLNCWEESCPHTLHNEQVSFFSQSNQVFSISNRASKRLFHKNMLVCQKTHFYRRSTEGMDVPNVDNLNIGILDQSIVSPIKTLDTVLLGKCLGTVFTSCCTSNNRLRWQMLQSLGKVMRDTSTSNHSPLQRRTFQRILDREIIKRVGWDRCCHIAALSS